MDLREVGQYLTCDFAIICYEELTEGSLSGAIEPFDFFVTLDDIYAIILTKKANPLNAIHLVNDRIAGYQDSVRYSFYYYLELKIHNDINSIFIKQDEKMRMCMHLISKETDKLLPQEVNTNTFDAELFNWKRTKEHVDSLPDFRSRLLYLVDISTKYEQEILDVGEHLSNFGQKCKLEINSLKEQQALAAMRSPYEGDVYLSKQRGKRIDLIRVINAMYELRFFHDKDEQIPTKEIVMKSIGKALGVELATYDSDLSQAFTSGNIENNISIFEQMSKITTKQVTGRL